MFKLRQYQRDAVDSLFGYFVAGNKGNPLIVLPTGSGKSIVQASFIQETLEQWPSERFLLLTHVKELIQQNESKLPGDMDVGVYSAGLGRRELGHKVTIGGIQSLYKRAHDVGDIGIVIVDEAHLITKSKSTMYQRFISDLHKFCPHAKVIGMSATPFRLDSGPLIRGDSRIFTDIAYSVSIKELIELGYLAPLVSAPINHRVDTKNVKKAKGEFVTGDLERCMLDNDNTEKSLDEVEALCADRSGWLVFCVGVEHAQEVCDAISKRGYVAKVVIGSTPKEERKQAIEDFKQNKIRALVSVGVLTTGFDAPSADALICLRPTMSPGLWVQIVGRVSRPSPGKENGLVLDFTENSFIHGPVDLIEVQGDGDVKTSPYRVCPECGAMNEPKTKECADCGASFKKECKNCGSLVDIDARVCPDCGKWFSVKRSADHSTKASSEDIISSDTPSAEKVEEWQFDTHYKEGKPPSLKVTYWTGLRTYQEWVCVQHSGYASEKAALWWVNHGGKAPTPKTVGEAFERIEEIKMPDEIRVKRDGKYWTVLSQ